MIKNMTLDTFIKELNLHGDAMTLSSAECSVGSLVP